MRESESLPRMLRQDEVLEVTGLGHTTLWRLERRGEFPRRRRLMGRIVAWREDEVRDWIESREPVPVPDGGGDDDEG